MVKLLAPKNSVNWDMRDPDSTWQYLGSMQTVAGKRISEESALSFSAVFAATRIISEGIAQLPCNLIRYRDYRTFEKAVDHPLYRIVHDVPNPEMDKMTWFDMQTAFLPNWGNAYAEIERVGRDIVALWPIHPSRIPLNHITRNSRDPSAWLKIVAGQPGEIVYWVRNDDGSVTPIPASDMLHVPGVLSCNGITGQSIIRWAANSIGIGIATEEHAGSFFKNGAVSKIALTTDKIVGKEAADRLRQSWQNTYAGSSNHYKALILEEGMKPQILNMSPEDSQLIASRQFSVSEIARWWKVPPHMLGDLSRATFSNIEQQYLEFVTHSLGPWVTRWEAAMFRQLLTEEEQKSYRFKFNLMAMLRGDSASRSAFYKSLFDMGVASPNDIRELEDWNPVEGGDQRFIPGNNLIPLEKATELADAQIEKTKAPPPAPAAPEPVENDEADEDEAIENLTSTVKELVVHFTSVPTKNDLERGFATIAGQIDASTATYEATAARMQATTNDERDAVSELIVNQAQATREHAAAAIGQLRERLDALPGAIVEPLADGIAGIGQSVRSKLESLENTQKQGFSVVETAISTGFQLNSAQLSELPDAFVAKIPPPPEPPPPPDTSVLEAVAIREARLAEQQAADEARLTAERDTTERVLRLALKRSIDGLATWEAKALKRSAEKPQEWKAWRESFYSRFRKHFEADLGEFSGDFERCSVILDLPWAADRYAARSIADLKTLDTVAADNWHDRVKECVEHFLKRDWTDRAETLAGEMIERGKRLFNERKERT